MPHPTWVDEVFTLSRLVSDKTHIMRAETRRFMNVARNLLISRFSGATHRFCKAFRRFEGGALMTALMQSRWVLGLSLLALCSAGPAFAQAPPLPFSFTFDENGHGLETLPSGAVVPRTSSILSDPVVGLGVSTLFYPLPFPVREGFVGFSATEPDFGLSDVLHFSSTFGGGVFFYSNPTAPGEPADLADVSLISYLMVLGAPIFPPFIPEVGSEGANGASYVPGATDPGFSLAPGIAMSYTIISDAGPGSTVPEPSSFVLLAAGVGLSGLARVTRRRHRRK